MFGKFALHSAVGAHNSGLGFGCMGVTSFYGDPMPVDKAMELFQTVYDAGCRHYDTAEVYTAPGDIYNEKVLGQFLATVPRDSYSVATKYFPMTNDYTYETVKPRLEASLSRLGLDYVDLYYAHRVTSLEGGLEFCRTGKRLQEEGLIKEIGLSEVGGEWLQKCHAVAPIGAVQQEWSLLTRNLETDLVPVCKELNIPIVAYSPLARNLLATKVEAPPNDWRSSVPRFSAENLAKNAKITDILHEMATKYNNGDCTPAQLALAWLFVKAQELGVMVIPIPGTTKISNAMSNFKAAALDITTEDAKTLESLANMVAGARGDESYVKIGIEAQK